MAEAHGSAPPAWRDEAEDIASEAAMDAAEASGGAKHVKRLPSAKIIGGTNAPKGKYQGMVALGPGPGYGYICGGALIFKDWILTAAHCVYGLSPQQVKIGLWDNRNMNQVSGGGFPAYTPELGLVDEIIVHPSYDFYHDIALVHLAAPSTLDPIEIAETTPAVGSQTTVLGWGNMEPYGDQAVQQPNILQAVDVTVRALEVCQTPIFAGHEICAGDPDEGLEGHDSCHGDSGGPLIDADGYHVGIVSRGREDGNKRCAAYPGVYTDSTAYRNWIDLCRRRGGGETGDPAFNSCPAGCGHVLTLELETDNYGSETSWSLEHAETCQLAHTCNSVSSWTYLSHTNYVGATKIVVSDSLCHGETYRFIISDTFGDGICCGQGPGQYRLYLDGVLLKTGGEFRVADETLVPVGVSAWTPEPTAAVPVPKPTVEPTAAATTTTRAPLTTGNIIFQGLIGGGGTFEIVGANGVVARLPPSLNGGNIRILAEVAGGSCVPAAVSFTPTPRVTDYLKTGTISGYHAVTDVVVESGTGTVKLLPTRFMTGYANQPPGFVMTTVATPRPHNAFAGIRNQPIFKRCNSEAITGGETLTLSWLYNPRVLFNGEIGSTGTFADGLNSPGVVSMLPPEVEASKIRIRAEISGGNCGNALISFRPSESLCNYLKYGTIGGGEGGTLSSTSHHRIVDVQIESKPGSVKVPSSLFYGGAEGWILMPRAQPRLERVFAGTFPHGAWDRCNGNYPRTGDEMVTLVWYDPADERMGRMGGGEKWRLGKPSGPKKEKLPTELRTPAESQ